jgi:pimeloyl-ACP methyl ester carboxylesterase
MSMQPQVKTGPALSPARLEVEMARPDVGTPEEVLDAIEFEEVGTDGPPILWLHGLDGPAPDRPAIERLAEHHRVVVPAYPGFEDSARPEHCDSIGDLAHLCLSLLQRKHLHDVTVIGCSLGGWVAAEMAFWRPSRVGRLVLVDALGIRVGGPTDRDIADLFVVSPESRRALLFHDPEKGGPLPAELDDTALHRRMRSEEATAVYGWEPYMCDPKLLRRLRWISVPTCVIWGAEDRLVGTDYGRAFADALPDSHFEVIPDAGHNPHIEQADAFLDVVGRFFEEQSRSLIPTTQRSAL